ncbi:MAG: HAMP domain-containing histidine kinase, partial [Acidobacteria bacterium]|nr:HAMP domain-containing histidine kinase [Acidobacteriota bacterium]
GYPSILREAALNMSTICDDIQKGKLPREKVREVRTAAMELLRICNLIALHQVSDVTIEIDYVLRALREYVVTGAQTEISKAISKVPQLISQAINRLQGFARSRGVTLDVIESSEVLVEVAEHDVSRAISNLLHNAIKYSWIRKKDEAPWIAIRVRTDSHYVYIDFENWGVPIPKEELERELIFKLGYRGRKASDRGRSGTGIGLTDARRVAREHGGDVIVKSHPARSGGRDDDYQQPFITTATFKLPLYPDLQNKE